MVRLFVLGSVVVLALATVGCSASHPVPQLVSPDSEAPPEDAWDGQLSEVASDYSTTDDVLPQDSAGIDMADDQYVPPDLQGDVCTPDCDGMVCGSDGCGGECGQCAPGTPCVEGRCQTTVGCTPGAKECAGTLVIQCDDTGSGWLPFEECADKGKGCQFGFCSGCAPKCDGKGCGPDGCGGSCGTCPEGSFCGQGICMMGCSSPQCALGKACFVADGVPGLCGGTLTFDTNMEGNAISDDVNVQEEYLAAGIQLYSDSPEAIVMTNYYYLASDSAGNSCATRVGQQEYWTHPIFVRFLVPGPEGYMQGAVNSVSMYIGKTWQNGIVVAGYAPGDDPTDDSTDPVAVAFTQQENTAFVKLESNTPMGHIYIGPYEDPNFTIDDFQFGPIRLVQ